MSPPPKLGGIKLSYCPSVRLSHASLKRSVLEL